MSLCLRTRRNRLLAIRSDIDAAGGGALQLFGGSMADTPETPASGSPLATVQLSAVSFGLHATDAVMTMVEAVGNASQSGLVTWGRFVDGDGLAIYDAPAGVPGSGAPIVVSNGQPVPSAQVYIGGVVTVNATFSEP